MGGGPQADDWLARERRNVIRRFAHRIRFNRGLEQALVLALALDGVALLAALGYAVSAPASAGTGALGVLGGLIDGEGAVLVGAVVAAGQYLYGELHKANARHAQARRILEMIRDGDPRIDLALRLARDGA